MAAGGRTIAVLASGVLNIYPPEHDKLADEVAAHGAVISESPPRVEPLAGPFPQRNRIISGLSLGVIVVEAAERSGALITARHAMEQGREVFAVPGSVDSRMSRGCHRLIRDGAKLVETADDVLEELGPLVEAAPRDDGVKDPSSGRTVAQRTGAAGAGRRGRRGDADRRRGGSKRPRRAARARHPERVGNAAIVRRLSGTTVIRA